MRFDFSDDQADIKATARALLDQRSSMASVRSASEASGTDDALWKELSELGWPTIAVTDDLGGQGLGLVELAVISEELGYACAPAPLLSTACALELVVAGADPAAAQQVVADVAGGASAAVGVAGSAIAGAEAASWIVVLEDGGGRLLDRSMVGVEQVETIDPGRPAGFVTAPDDAGIPLDAAGVTIGSQRAAIAVAAELVGVGQRALDMTLAYVKDRQQFGKAVGSYQAVQHKCVGMLNAVEGARSAVYYAAWAGDADPTLLAEASALAKAAASDAGRQATADAIQAHGGIGFTWEADVHWLYKRAQTSAVWFGGAGAHRAQLAQLLRARVAASV